MNNHDKSLLRIFYCMYFNQTFCVSTSLRQIKNRCSYETYCITAQQVNFVSRVLITFWLAFDLEVDLPINVHQFVLTAYFPILVGIIRVLTFKHQKMPHWLYIGCVVYAVFGIDPRFSGSHKITGLFPSGMHNKREKSFIWLIDWLKLRDRTSFHFWCLFWKFLWKDYYSPTFLERTLFTRNTSEPQSYVVGFKYVGDVFSRVITSGEIWSNARVSVLLLKNILSVWRAKFLLLFPFISNV